MSKRNRRARRPRKRELYVARCELRLSLPDVEPLFAVPTKPDPLEAFQQVFARQDHARGERAEILVDLLPLNDNERLEFRDRQRKAEIDKFVKESTAPRSTNLLELLSKDPAAGYGAAPSIAVPRNEAAEALARADVHHVAHKVSAPHPLFRVQVLMRAWSPDRARAQDHIVALREAWEPWSSRNHFEWAGTYVLNTWFFNHGNAPVLRWWFDYRAASGRFGPVRHRGAAVVSTHELAAWFTPPASTAPPQTATPPSGRRRPPRRPAAAQTPPPGDADATARLLPPDDDTIVSAVDGILDDGLLYGIGRRGGTVDRLAADVVARATRAGAGAVVLDADGAGEQADVLSWGGPSSPVVPLLTADVTRAAAGWNPVVPPVADAPVDRAAVTVRALTIAAGSTDQSQAASLIYAAVSTLQTLATFLPQELAPTLLQIRRLIDDAEWREAVLPVLDGPTRRFWSDILAALDGDVVRRVTDLVRSLEEDATAVALLGQAQTTYDPYTALAAGKTVVLSGGITPLNKALAVLLWLDASDAARTLAESGTEPAPVLVATAAHQHASDHEGLFVNDLAATVESGVRVALLTDRPDLHGADVRRTLQDLATAVAVDAVDAGARVAAEWIGLDGASQLQVALDNLDAGRCLVATARDHWQPRPLRVGQARPDPSGGGRSPAEVPAGQTLRSTWARLEGLEDRIAEHLLSPVPPEPDGDPDGDPVPAGPQGPGGGSNVIQFDPSRRRKDAPNAS